MQKQLIIKVLALCLLSALISGIVVYASVPTYVQILGGGDYPGGPSYSIYTDGTNFFAKNAQGNNDYSGSDFEDVFQDAQNALTNGGSIYISAGTYYLDERLNITRSKITLYGEGQNTLITQQAGTNLARFIYVTGTYFEMHDLFIDGAYATNTVSVGLYLENSADYNWIHHCVITHFPEMCIRQEANVGNIECNYITEAHQPLFIGEGDNTVHDNFIGGAGSAGLSAHTTARYAVYCSSFALTFTGNWVFYSNDVLLYVDSSNQKLIIANNVFESALSASPQGYGIYLASAGTGPHWGMHTIIEGNIFREIETAGIRVGPNIFNVTIATNEFYNMPYAISQASTTNSDFFQIRGNLFYNISTAIISTDYLTDNYVVTDNLGYNPLGYISNPWDKTYDLLTDGGDSAGPPDSATTYKTIWSPKAIYITGGTVSDISVNGQTIFTATEATVYLYPGDTFEITYSSAPTVTVMGQ